MEGTEFVEPSTTGAEDIEIRQRDYLVRNL
jgi:hypothetical protein